MLISLQSHSEVLTTLDEHPELSLTRDHNGTVIGSDGPYEDGRIFVASVSPQVRASLAATFDISERKASHMIDQFLRGPHGLRAGGKHGGGFTWVVDTNIMREAVLALTTDEVIQMQNSKESPASDDLSSGLPKRPALSSACPGWICYAEKSKPFTIPHLSRLKSPQALAGTFFKSVLSKKLGVSPSQIWHLAIMPCFDKKLEASREELTDVAWQSPEKKLFSPPVRDVDCVITSRELLTLAHSRGMNLPNLPLKALPSDFTPHIPDETLDPFLFPKRPLQGQAAASGTSGGYLYHVLTALQSRNPGSEIITKPGRHDVVEYELLPPRSSEDEKPKPILTAARFYGFKNIQNLVRKLEPKRMPGLPGRKIPAAGSRRQPMSASSKGADYDYVEVMACPGGCTNGGGQIRIEDTQRAPSECDSETAYKPSSEEKRAWLRKVDEGYFSAESSDSEAEHGNEHPSPEPSIAERETEIHGILRYWSQLMEVPLSKLVYTTYRKVESDVGKNSETGNNDTARVVELAGKIGGGW